MKTLHEKGPRTKQELTKLLNLSLATVVTILKELLADGIVEQGEAQPSNGGRKPLVYQIVPNAKMALGVALTQHHVRMMLVNWKHDVLEIFREKILYENTKDYWDHIRAAVEQVLSGRELDEQNFVGINFCIGGKIVPEADYEDIIPEGIFQGLDLEQIRSRFSVPVYFSNNLKAAAFSNVGMLSGRNTCVYIQFDRVLGGAVISGGLFWGLSNRTGEFGRLYLGGTQNDREFFEMIEEKKHSLEAAQEGGAAGSEGREADLAWEKNCMQYYCSSETLRQESGMELDEFFQAVDSGDPAATALWKRCERYLIQEVYNLRAIFDINVMIGGEMVPYLKKYQDEIREALRVLDIYRENADYLRFSDGGEYDGAKGAALMLLERDEMPRA